jgi:hypothetical protein
MYLHLFDKCFGILLQVLETLLDSCTVLLQKFGRYLMSEVVSLVGEVIIALVMEPSHLRLLKIRDDLFFGSLDKRTAECIADTLFILLHTDQFSYSGTLAQLHQQPLQSVLQMMGSQQVGVPVCLYKSFKEGVTDMPCFILEVLSDLVCFVQMALKAMCRGKFLRVFDLFICLFSQTVMYYGDVKRDLVL